MKTAFETRVNAMEMEYRTALTDASVMTTLIGKNSEDIKTAMSSMSDVITKQETEIIGMQQSMQGINLAMDTRMAPLQAEVAGMKADTIKEVEKVRAEMRMQQEAIKTSGTGTDGNGRREEYIKPVMEYRAVSDMLELGDDKSIFRNWRVKLKDALKQILKKKEFLKIMEWAEDPNTELTGDETMDEIMQQAEDEYGIPQSLAVYEQMSEMLATLMLNKTDIKGEAFLMAKRASNGWIAWNRITRWYLAISGENLTDRMAMVMKPQQSKKDERVVYDVESWMDEMKECRAPWSNRAGMGLQVDCNTQHCNPSNKGEDGL